MKRGTIEHPKMLELSRLLGVKRYIAVGILESLWHWAAKYTPKGDIGKYSDEAIADGIGWDSDDAQHLIQSFVESRWVDRTDQHRLVVHDWSHHADYTLHARIARQREWFADGSIPSFNNLKGNKGSGENDKTEREDARLYYENSSPPKVQGQSSSSPPSDIGALASALALPKPKPCQKQPEADASSVMVEESRTDPVSGYSFILRGGDIWTLTQEKLAEYKGTYPVLDVDAEMCEAVQWCKDNPRKRKTLTGMPNFLNGWLSRNNKLLQSNGTFTNDFESDSTDAMLAALEIEA